MSQDKQFNTSRCGVQASVVCKALRVSPLCDQGQALLTQRSPWGTQCLPLLLLYPGDGKIHVKISRNFSRNSIQKNHNVYDNHDVYKVYRMYMIPYITNPVVVVAAGVKKTTIITNIMDYLNHKKNYVR